MKLSTTLFTLLFILSVNYAWAQVPLSNQVLHPNVDKVRLPHATHSATRDAYQMYLNYAIADYDDGSYIYNLSSNPTDSFALNYAAVSFDAIAGYTTDQHSPVIWSDLGLASPYPDTLRMTIDSIFLPVTHENNSGNADIINVQLVRTQSDGTPSTNPADIVWQQSDTVTTSLSWSGNWLGPNSLITLSYAPNQKVITGQPLAIVINYIDPSNIDSFGILGNFLDDGSGQAITSTYPNSYVEFTDIPSIATPTQNSSITYGGTQGNYQSQNWFVTAQVHFSYVPNNDPPPSGDSCYTYFRLYPDTLVAHHWIAEYYSSGVPPFTYTWSWGDGTSSTGEDLIHTYSQAGFYDLCLNVTDGTGCVSGYCDSTTYIFRQDADNSVISMQPVNKSVATGIVVNKPVINKLALSPNPCATCYISGVNNPADLFITDLLGRNVKASFVKSSGGYNVQMPAAEIGFYIIRNRVTGEAIKFVKE